MAIREFTYNTGLSASLYATIRDSTGQYWNATTVAFEAYNASNWTTTKYLIATTEPGKAGLYQYTVPAITAAVDYRDNIWFLPSGSASAGNDVAVRSGTFGWNGTNVIDYITAASTSADFITEITDAVVASGGLSSAQDTKLTQIHTGIQSIRSV